jgi:hypothetical protein
MMCILKFILVIGYLIFPELFVENSFLQLVAHVFCRKSIIYMCWVVSEISIVFVCLYASVTLPFVLLVLKSYIVGPPILFFFKVVLYPVGP